jgi:hypothetical protein
MLKSGLTTSVFRRCVERGYAPDFFLPRRAAVRGAKSLHQQTSTRREKSMDSWFYWALLSATFAALTAIFTKVGLKDVEPDYATVIPAFVIAVVIAGYVYLTDKWSSPFAVGPRTLSSFYPGWLQVHHGFATFAR